MGKDYVYELKKLYFVRQKLSVGEIRTSQIIKFKSYF